MHIRTTFISGFPGETPEQHQELLEFVQSFGFDAMGVFPYSPEPGTPAGRLHEQGDAIDPEVVQARVEELMLAQQEVVFTRNQQLAAQEETVDVLIDEVTGTVGEATAGVSAGGTLYAGRHRGQAPEVDAATYVLSENECAPGEVITCRIIDHDEYDLIARPTAELDSAVKLPVME
ncbi:MAG: hypothetical protein R3336_07690, partial [Phycisphaeraceae bacterium]|nr:hypothetical protein [Phycisphaeraceae bacterium]